MRTAALLSVALLAFACAAAPASDTRVLAEIERLEKTLKAVESADLPQDVHDLFEAHRSALERAKKATSPEYRLYRLRDPFVGIETLAFLAKEKDARANLEGVRKAWLAQQPRFEAKAPKAHGSLLERALTESAANRADKLFHASLSYAKISSPWSGVYYLGEGAGNLAFRDFLLSIADEKSTEKGPTREQVTSMLASLEHDTLTFFGNDVTNQAAIPVSVRLKETHELLDDGRIDGATLLLTEARAALSRRGGPKGNYPATTRGGSVVSMIQAWAGDEPAPMNEALKSGVVPFYAAMFAQKAPRKEAMPARVTVTLVRWPYT